MGARAGRIIVAWLDIVPLRFEIREVGAERQFHKAVDPHSAHRGYNTYMLYQGRGQGRDEQILPGLTGF